MSNNDVNTSIAYILESRREKESRAETRHTRHIRHKDRAVTQ